MDWYVIGALTLWALFMVLGAWRPAEDMRGYNSGVLLLAALWPLALVLIVWWLVRHRNKAMKAVKYLWEGHE